MLQQLLNAMRQQSDMEGGSRAMVRHGIVSGYDPGSYCAKVTLMPEGNETGWLPIVSPWIGNSWGLFAPPSIGDAVEVQFQEDDPEAGYLCQRFYNDSDRPLSVESGEFWLVHKSGSFLKFENNGNVELHTAADLNATVAGNADIQVEGNITSRATQWTHTGPLTVHGLVTGTMGYSFTGTPPGGGPTGYVEGAIYYHGVQITADAGSTQTFNGKRVDDTLRVTNVQTGSSTSGTVA